MQDPRDCPVRDAWEIYEIPPRPAGETRLKVAYRYDANGVIEVEAEDLLSGRVLPKRRMEGEIDWKALFLRPWISPWSSTAHGVCGMAANSRVRKELPFDSSTRSARTLTSLSSGSGAVPLSQLRWNSHKTATSLVGESEFCNLAVVHRRLRRFRWLTERFS